MEFFEHDLCVINVIFESVEEEIPLLVNSWLCVIMASDNFRQIVSQLLNVTVSVGLCLVLFLLLLLLVVFLCPQHHGN